MELTQVLLKAIMLIMQERKEYKDVKSKDQIKRFLKYAVVKAKSLTNGENALSQKLIHFINELLETDSFDFDSYKDSLAMILVERPQLAKLMNNLITKELTDNARILRLRELENYILKEEFFKLLKQAMVEGKRLDINLPEFIRGFRDKVLELEVKAKSDMSDKIVDEVDFDNDESLNKAFQNAIDLTTNATVFKTGFECINKMTQGGLRKGEFVTIAALPHNYKSGMAKTFFVQLPRLNEPVMIDKNKKPLMIFFSLEEEVSVVMLFIYQYFKYLKEKKIIKDDDNVSKEEMVKYIKENFLNETKYSLKIIRMNPVTTKYTDILDVIKMYEDQNYEIHAIFIDYLSQISTIGLDKSGPSGVEFKNLFKVIRNELVKKKILVVTPHQISTEAKRLIKNGIPDIEFVKHLKGKGYYAHSGQLDQEIDLELFVHKAYLNRKPVLTVQRGKHRIPTQVEDENDLYTILQFPRKAPIVEDHVEDGKIVTACIKNLIDNEDEFTF